MDFHSELKDIYLTFTNEINNQYFDLEKEIEVMKDDLKDQENKNLDEIWKIIQKMEKYELEKVNEKKVIVDTQLKLEEELKHEIDHLKKYIETNNKLMEEKKLELDKIKLNYNENEEEIEKTEKIKHQKLEQIKQYYLDIDKLNKQLTELEKNKLNIDRVRQEQILKKQDIEKSIREGPNSNFNMLQKKIIEIYDQTQKIEFEYKLQSDECKNFERENLDYKNNKIPLNYDKIQRLKLIAEYDKEELTGK